MTGSHELEDSEGWPRGLPARKLVAQMMPNQRSQANQAASK